MDLLGEGLGVWCATFRSVRVLPYESGEHRDNRRVVLLRVPHDPFKAVDAAEALGRVVSTQQLDGFNVRFMRACSMHAGAKAWPKSW
ncbi:hypothetical protein ACTMTU_12515 [Streptomyces sp. OZ13]|uniref:hypothetical protein n=1 Tax=Streptomyces sp. OZ13 TaxID=3452210 RepID=UPI003F8AA70E